MSFGYEQQEKVYTGDTYLIDAYIHDKDNQPIEFTDINAVYFTIYKPSDQGTGDPPTIEAVAGEVMEDDGHGQFLVPAATIDEPGEYKGIAQFELTDGQLKSVVVDFDVIDAFQSQDLTGPEWIADQVWTRLEDCFDSEMGNAGPWLRDMTLAKFDQTKLLQLFPEAVTDINLTFNPQLNLTPSSYPYEDMNSNQVAVQSLLVATIRHLMRAYTEQPDVINSQVGYFDRKRYQEAWARILTVEEKRFREILAMWKRGMIGLGVKTIVATKAGRLLPGTLRTRYAARGW
jgi:hypothetical protein